MGRTVRGEHETAIVAHRGRPQTVNKAIRSTFDAPVGQHSEKPEAFYRIVEQLRPGPYCELFARRRRDGWTSVGDEISEIDEGRAW
jgi:N6-adenosine-specific RNA methylase IME4